ncbi:MAG: hypothetical protein RSD51_03345 [Malacoplasma sp.]
MTYVSYKATIKKLEKDLEFKEYVIKTLSERIAELEKLIKIGKIKNDR